MFGKTFLILTSKSLGVVCGRLNCSSYILWKTLLKNAYLDTGLQGTSLSANSSGNFLSAYVCCLLIWLRTNFVVSSNFIKWNISSCDWQIEVNVCFHQIIFPYKFFPTSSFDLNTVIDAARYGNICMLKWLWPESSAIALVLIMVPSITDSSTSKWCLSFYNLYELYSNTVLEYTFSSKSG